MHFNTTSGIIGQKRKQRTIGKENLRRRIAESYQKGRRVQDRKEILKKEKEMEEEFSI